MRTWLKRAILLLTLTWASLGLASEWPVRPPEFVVTDAETGTCDAIPVGVVTLGLVADPDEAREGLHRHEFYLVKTGQMVAVWEMRGQESLSFSVLTPNGIEHFPNPAAFEQVHGSLCNVVEKLVTFRVTPLVYITPIQP